MARICHGRSKKKLKVKNRKETAKDRIIWADLAEKAKTHKGLYGQIMMMMTSKCIIQLQLPDATTCTYGASDVILLPCVLSSVGHLTKQLLSKIIQLSGTDTLMRMEHYWNDTDKGNPTYPKINLLHCHSLYHSPTCNSPGMNRGHRGERPAINRLINGTATNHILFRCLKFKLN
jgi:hypothetical protein